MIEKFNATHKDNRFYEKTQKQESAFIINHYAGSVKYKVDNIFIFLRNILSLVLFATGYRYEREEFRFNASRYRECVKKLQLLICKGTCCC